MSRFTITVGKATFECSVGRSRTTLTQLDTASGIVAAEDLAERGADWSRRARATVEGDDVMHGRVVEARPQEDGSMSLSLAGATMLSESLLPPMVLLQIDGREILYLAAREAGFAPEDINIEGLAEALAFEPLWVLAPVRGLIVRQQVRVGAVELVTGDAGREMLQRFSPPLDAKFADRLEDVDAFARVAVVGKRAWTPAPPPPSHPRAAPPRRARAKSSCRCGGSHGNGKGAGGFVGAVLAWAALAWPLALAAR